jgi:sec-independent protein translocase protein TatB
MFDISFSELALICVIALLVLGPERMPKALRTLGLWIGRASRTFTAMKAEIEREIGMDEVRRQLHNEAIMDQVKRLERDINAEKGVQAATPAPAPASEVEAKSEQSPSLGQAANGGSNNGLPPH